MQFARISLLSTLNSRRYVCRLFYKVKCSHSKKLSIWYPLACTLTLLQACTGRAGVINIDHVNAFSLKHPCMPRWRGPSSHSYARRARCSRSRILRRNNRELRSLARCLRTCSLAAAAGTIRSTKNLNPPEVLSKHHLHPDLYLVAFAEGGSDFSLKTSSSYQTC